MPGSSSDFLGRYVGERLGARWGQPVVVENRGGAGVSGTLVAKALPDGYTLWIGSTATLATTVGLYRKISYDPVKDFAPIALISRAPLLFVAHPSVPAANLREFINYARQNHGKVAYSSGDNGSASHLTSAFFSSLAGVNMLRVPYKGPGFLTALMDGEAHVASISASTVVPHVRAGRLKAYAVTSKSRFAAMPDIPTAAEAGLPGFEAAAWYGVVAPAGAPSAIIAKVNRDVVEILRAPETTRAFLAQGAEAAPGTPEEFGAWIRSEVLKWRDIIKTAGITPE
jgi:tripartite-type tricarboxylate transporter receptor subunit TctC